MRIIEKKKNIINELKKSKISTGMSSLEACNFLLIMEEEGKMIGAAGIGGLFNVPSVQVHSDYQGKGIGTNLLVELINEAKHRGYSFICGSRDPENYRVIKIEDKLGFYSIFRMHYSPKITRDGVITVFRFKGKIVAKSLCFFNSKFGTMILALILKIGKSFFRNAFTLSPEEYPDPDIMYMIRNFQKI